MPSICGPQRVTVTEGSLTPSYLTATTISTIDVALAGMHSLNLEFSLQRYPTITLNKTVNVWLLTVTPPPVYEDQAYVVNSANLYFTLQSFTLFPVPPGVTFS
jgi:hypothetical protein